jgi:hypothetical protein
VELQCRSSVFGGIHFSNVIIIVGISDILMAVKMLTGLLGLTPCSLIVSSVLNNGPRWPASSEQRADQIRDATTGLRLCFKHAGFRYCIPVEKRIKWKGWSPVRTPSLNWKKMRHLTLNSSSALVPLESNFVVNLVLAY